MDSTATGRPRVCILWRGGVSCPVSAAWHFCVAAHWSKYHCYKQAPSWYDLRCFKATLNPNKQARNVDVYISFIVLYKPTELFIGSKRFTLLQHQTAFRKRSSFMIHSVIDNILEKSVSQMSFEIFYMQNASEIDEIFRKFGRGNNMRHFWLSMYMCKFTSTPIVPNTTSRVRALMWRDEPRTGSHS